MKAPPPACVRKSEKERARERERGKSHTHKQNYIVRDDSGAELPRLLGGSDGFSSLVAIFCSKDLVSQRKRVHAHQPFRGRSTFRNTVPQQEYTAFSFTGTSVTHHGLHGRHRKSNAKVSFGAPRGSFEARLVPTGQNFLWANEGIPSNPKRSRDRVPLHSPKAFHKATCQISCADWRRHLPSFNQPGLQEAFLGHHILIQSHRGEPLQPNGDCL